MGHQIKKGKHKMQHFVLVLRYSDHKLVKKLGPYSSNSQANRADDGVNINLNDVDYYTLVKSYPNK
jgi:hypothetical protein